MILNHNTPRSNHALRQNQTIHTPISSNATLSPSLVGIKPSVCTVRWAKLSPFFPRAREHREKLHRLSVRAGKSFPIPPSFFPPADRQTLPDDCSTTTVLSRVCQKGWNLFSVCFSWLPLSHTFLLRVERRGVLRGRKVERVLGFASFNNKDTHREMGTQEGNRWVTRLKGLEGDRTGRNRVFCTTTSANSMMKL